MLIINSTVQVQYSTGSHRVNTSNFKLLNKYIIQNKNQKQNQNQKSRQERGQCQESNNKR